MSRKMNRESVIEIVYTQIGDNRQEHQFSE